MALPADYISGTITLTNGSPDFTGTGTGWQAADFREGDILLGVEDHAGQVYVIATITGNASGTLTQDWAGTSGTYTYRMRYEWDSSRVSAQARAMVELLGNGNLESIASLTGPGVVVLEGPHSAGIRPFTDFINGVAYDVQVDTLADRAAYDGQTAGFAVLVADVGDGRSAIYSKVSNTSGDWSDPAYITGPMGEQGDAGPVGVNPRGDYSPATAYAVRDSVQYQGSSWIATASTTGNAPPSLPTTSNAFWQLLARAGVNGTGTVTTVAAGSGITVNSTDPTAPAVALANVPTATIKGRVAAGTGVPTDLTGSQVTTLLDVFNTTRKGLVPQPTSGDATAGRVLSATGAWIDLPSSSDLEFTVSQLAIAAADANNIAQFLGTNGNRFADSFDALTYVDVAGATNLDTSVQGVLKPTVVVGADQIPTMTSATTAGVTVTASDTNTGAGFATWYVADKNNATSWVTNNGTTSGWVRFDFGAGATKTISTYTLIRRPGVPDQAPKDFILQGSNDGSAWTDLDARTNITSWADGVANAFQVATPSAYRYYRLSVSAVQAGGIGIGIAEMSLRIAGSINSLTVRSAAFTAASAPTKMKALINVKEVDAAVAGTDYLLDCSRDGGTTWATMTLTERYTLPSGLRVVESAETDVSGQPTGTAPRWRFRTLNNKNVELHDLYLYWS